MTRRFTGGHMLALMLAFFGTVVAVNFVMATLAVRTFGGTVVDNSYVPSQHYNHWLDQARAQRALGWTASGPDPDRHARRRSASAAARSTAPCSAPSPCIRSGMRSTVCRPGNGRYSLAPLPGPLDRSLHHRAWIDRARLIETLQ
jgi:hypothetical protein